MNLSCKAFKDLSVSELHRIMMTRCTVFVVEQHNPCQEIDETDAKCFHLWLEDDGQILSYARVFQDVDGISHIGRVLSTVRGKGYGARIMEAAIEACHSYFGKASILLESQCAVSDFYAKHGFKVISEMFLENEIPHVLMRREG